MAANPQRVRNITFNTGRIVSKVRGIKFRAMTKLARELQASLKESLSVQGTKKLRSQPGEPPRRQTGKLKRATKVVFKGGKIVAKTTNVGIWLEGGTSRIAPRPFILPLLQKNRQKWERRARALMRQEAKK